MQEYLRNFSESDGILIFDKSLDERFSTYDPDHLDRIEEAESHHFWFSSRREKICQAFDQFVEKDARILEIGGGTGYIAEELARRGYQIELSDAASNGLLYAKKRGIKKLYQFDLYKPPFKEAFDLICLFDVLEHLECEEEALNQIKSMLRPGGKIILTVPAHSWLWSRDDRIAGHKKRYTKRAMKRAFIHSGFKPLSLRYFFIFILPFLLLRRWIRKDRGTPLGKNDGLKLTLPLWLSSFFRLLTKLEFFMDRLLPNLAGGSLLAIAKRD
ncbi:MAG: Ubiquinone biosynthesis O-methyltransferase [Chlamydiae bacterium]|nr:Ubiquinone biosynthesis O-methyltransferase [Chlamydiota bacterium]